MQQHLKETNIKLKNELSNLEFVDSDNIVPQLPRTFSLPTYGITSLNLALDQIESQ
jgi:hypothetical protein